MKSPLLRVVRRRIFSPKPAVDESRFQGPDEPYPRHWRRFPAPWPPIEPRDPPVQTRLREAVNELPQTWGEVVERRDVQGQTAEEVSATLGLTSRQQRSVLNRARAVVRERLAALLTRDGPP